MNPALPSTTPAKLVPSSTTVPLPPQLAERLRRQSNVRLISVGDAIIILLVTPATLFPRFDPIGFVAFVVLLLCAFAAIALNSRGAVQAAANVLLTGLLVAIMGAVTSTAYLRGGLDLSQMRLLDLFTLPIALSSMTMPRLAPLIVAAISSLFTVLALLLFPHTPMLTAYYLQQYPDAAGSVWDIFVFALGLQWGTALVSYVAAISVRAALQYAARAEALYEAHQQIAAQAEALARHEQLLTDGMQRIQETYAAVIRGQWTARVQAPDNELLPVALSFNRLLDRSARLMQAQEELRHLLAAVRETEQAVVRYGPDFAAHLPRCTGTPLDELLELLHDVHASDSARRLPFQGPTPTAYAASARPGAAQSNLPREQSSWPITLIPLHEDDVQRTGQHPG